MNFAEEVEFPTEGVILSGARKSGTAKGQFSGESCLTGAEGAKRVLTAKSLRQKDRAKKILSDFFYCGSIIFCFILRTDRFSFLVCKNPLQTCFLL